MKGMGGCFECFLKIFFEFWWNFIFLSFMSFSDKPSADNVRLIEVPAISGVINQGFAVK